MRRTANGFTALEISVTIIIVGLLAAVALPSIAPLLERSRLRQAAQEIEQVLRKAQQYAISKDRTVYVVFNNPAAAAAGSTSHPANQSYTLVVGDPCKPDDNTQRLVNLGTSDRIALSSTLQLPPQVNIDTTTFSYGTCPAPVNANDMAANTNNSHIVAFDYQGLLLQGSATDPSNAGQYVQLSSLRGNFGQPRIYVLTQLGDIGTI